VLGKSDFKMLLKWRLKMLKYKEELLKAQAPPVDEEELLAAQAAEAAAAKVPEKELTEEEKNALIREELAQLRANLLAKKKREKKKVRGVCPRLCVCVCMCVNAWRIPSSPCATVRGHDEGLTLLDSRYAPRVSLRPPIPSCLSPPWQRWSIWAAHARLQCVCIGAQNPKPPSLARLPSRCESVLEQTGY
jgi:hypothetical protein